MYDYLLVGAGLFNSVFAHEAIARGATCCVIEARDHVGGNVYTRDLDGIQVHEYGAHIFRTGSRRVWEYMQTFATFNHFINSPIAIFRGEVYNLPFNMNTFSRMWGVTTPAEARRIIDQQSAGFDCDSSNLEEHAIALVGCDIYEKLIKEYTEKQWGRPCSELPSSILRRLPVRYTYNNNYFDAPYQGVPVGGYTQIIESMLLGCDVVLQQNYLADPARFRAMARRVIYTGTIDSYFNYCFGKLDYRSLRFEHELLDIDNYQGVAVVNYTGHEVPYTRVIEHKHFEFGTQPGTVITREYPLEWTDGSEPYYPVTDVKNTMLYQQYATLAQTEHGISFCGRLGSYQYLDMEETVINALAFAERELSSP